MHNIFLPQRARKLQGAFCIFFFSSYLFLSRHLMKNILIHLALESSCHLLPYFLYFSLILCVSDEISPLLPPEILHDEFHTRHNDIFAFLSHPDAAANRSNRTDVSQVSFTQRVEELL